MAIYHLSHGYVGRGSQKQPHTAAAHSNYITRPTRATEVMGERMPIEWRAAAAWLKAQEDSDRVNARVIDKIEVALPKELNHVQRAALVRDFAQTLTQGRASWLAAFHDGPKDEDNPHAHIILRDRDATLGPGQGRRVILTTERGTIDHIRQLWQEKANLALEQAGSAARIDHRTLAAQGIEREPQIHVGPKTQALTEKGVALESRPATVHRIDFTTGRRVAVSVDYPVIDQGRTRADYNAEIRARNTMKERAAEDLRPQMPGQPKPGALAMAADEADHRPARSQEADALDWTERGGMVSQQRSANVWMQAASRINVNEHSERGRGEVSESFLQPVQPMPFLPAGKQETEAERAAKVRSPLSFEQLRASNGWVGEYPCGPGLVRTDQLHHEQRERLEKLARERFVSDGVAAQEKAGREGYRVQQEKHNAALTEQERAANAFTQVVTGEAKPPSQGEQARMFGKNPFGTAAPPAPPRAEPSPAVLAVEAKRAQIEKYGHPQGMGEGPDWTVTRAQNLKKEEQAQQQAREDVARDELAARAPAQRADNLFTRNVTEKNLADLTTSSRAPERGLER